MINLNTVR